MINRMDVIGMGNPCVDLLAHVNEIPVAGESSSLFETGIQGGGKVATALVTLARLGAKAGIIGTVGDDANGTFCVKDFKQHGVDISHLSVKANADTPFAIVLIDDKYCERSILYRRGQAARQPVEVDAAYLRTAKILHLETANPWDLEAARIVKANGGLVSFDADYYSQEMDELTPLVDLFIGSSYYFNALFSGGDLHGNMERLRQKGPQTVVFTFGAEGCALLDAEGFTQLPAYRVSVVDTTGAGDVFHGAFLYGVLQGWNHRRCAQFASATSAIKCLRPGGRAGIPTTEIVEVFMQTGSFDQDELDDRVKGYQKIGVMG